MLVQSIAAGRSPRTSSCSATRRAARENRPLRCTSRSRCSRPASASRRSISTAARKASPITSRTAAPGPSARASTSSCRRISAWRAARAFARRQRGDRVRQLLQGDRRDRAHARLRRHRHAWQRQLSDAAGPFDGRHADHAAQRQLRRFRRARHARPDQFRRHRRKPLRRDGARSAPPAPAGRRPAHRLDRGAQPAVQLGSRNKRWSARA